MKELPKLTEEDINEIVKEYYGFSVEEADEMIGNLSNKYYSLREEYQKLIKKNEKLNHYKLLYQKVKDRNDKAIEYVNFLAIGTQGIKEELLDKCQIGMVKFNKTICGDELLEILKGENNE